MGQRFQEVGKKRQNMPFFAQVGCLSQIGPKKTYFDVFGPLPEIFDPSVIHHWNQWFFLIFWDQIFSKNQQFIFIFIRVYSSTKVPRTNSIWLKIQKFRWVTTFHMFWHYLRGYSPKLERFCLIVTALILERFLSNSTFCVIPLPKSAGKP